jgi:hypothetical protein
MTTVEVAHAQARSDAGLLKSTFVASISVCRKSILQYETSVHSACISMSYISSGPHSASLPSGACVDHIQVSVLALVLPTCRKS